ncbi:MAG: tripartite tricarboxylate transporter permease [Candidatus Rokuibacteriota bacterium]
MLESLAGGFLFILNPASLTAALIGLVAGVVVGALPGLTATMAVAVLSPFTFFMRPEIGIPFLLAVFKAAIYGGSIPAITINTPGTAAAAATTLDGYVLARRGETMRALQMSLYASVFGDMTSTLLLIVAASQLAVVAVRFGSPEFVMLYLIALTMIAGVSGRNAARACLSAGAGFLIAVIGLDPMSGQQRFTFGVPDLIGGISFVPFLIGLFALSEILVQGENPRRSDEVIEFRRDEPRVTLGDMRRVMPTILRSTGIGFFIGILPGIGAEIACWMAYGTAKRASKHPEQFGRGSIEGVAAAEAGNNAACPGDLIPMMVLGIPGDTVTAVLLGAFMAQGLTPGPLLFQKHSVLVYGFFAILLISNLMLLGVGYVAIRYFRHITLIPEGLLYPAVASLCFAGSFAVNSSYFDLVLTLAGGVLGYAMRKTQIPIPPMVIAMLVAPGLENALRQSLLMSDTGLLIFVARPIAAGMVLALIAAVGLLVWQNLRSPGEQEESA